MTDLQNSVIGPWVIVWFLVLGHWLFLSEFLSMSLPSLVMAAEKQTMEIPDHFPKFIVPGHERQMQRLRELFYLHYRNNGPQATLWDQWLPDALLWPAAGPDLSSMDRRWAKALSARRIDAEGYVSTHQHDGPAHAEGWPFPMWHNGKGVGWHFAGTGVPAYDAPRADPKTWKLSGAAGREIGATGWTLELNEAGATAEPPAIELDPFHAPFVRLNWWAKGLEESHPYLEWTTRENSEFSSERRLLFNPARGDSETRTMLALYKHPQWKGTITRLRLCFDNPAGASVTVKSFHTAYDSRQNINNTFFVRGCWAYFNWTGDVEFLGSNIGRIRKAMRYAMDEFDTRRRKLIYTPWVGHDGRSGIQRDADGSKHVLPGRGIGNNYWDILPFGGEDCLATIYYYDAVLAMADLEERIASLSPSPGIPGEGKADAAGVRAGEGFAFDPRDLRAHAAEVKNFAGRHFWNEKAGRFIACIDADGISHDYGFTFLNCEAIYHDFATAEQAQSIYDWLDGKRTVEGDSSTGADIYRWRFGPRSTTRRNLDWYVWCWSNPESVPWGYQVQDGGAVLGWSYHDLMARLKTLGPDNAARRLAEIIQWFDEVQEAGGYRTYYEGHPERGTMQGANVAGGLGLDKEFVESVLVPQVMLYGFMGIRATPKALYVSPRLPADWPSLAITRIHFHDHVLDLKAEAKTVHVTIESIGQEAPVIRVPAGFTLAVRG
jgi:hypothetical protein